MRTKKVTRYYCDHCSKGALVKSAMQRHESICYRNKDRICLRCQGEEDFAVKQSFGNLESQESVKTHGVECPDCLMAKVVQHNASLDQNDRDDGCGIWYPLDQYRNDCASWMAEMYPPAHEEARYPL